MSFACFLIWVISTNYFGSTDLVSSFNLIYSFNTHLKTNEKNTQIQNCYFSFFYMQPCCWYAKQRQDSGGCCLVALNILCQHIFKIYCIYTHRLILGSVLLIQGIPRKMVRAQRSLRKKSVSSKNAFMSLSVSLNDCV